MKCAGMRKFGEIVADDTDDGEADAGGDVEAVHDDGDDGSRQVGRGREINWLGNLGSRIGLFRVVVARIHL